MWIITTSLMFSFKFCPTQHYEIQYIPPFKKIKYLEIKNYLWTHIKIDMVCEKFCCFAVIFHSMNIFGYSTLFYHHGDLLDPLNKVWTKIIYLWHAHNQILHDLSNILIYYSSLQFCCFLAFYHGFNRKLILTFPLVDHVLLIHVWHKYDYQKWKKIWCL